MCAVSWHSTAPHGGHIALSASALAAVPLVTGKTRAPGCSNTVRTLSCSCAVKASPPYAMLVPVLDATIAAKISGATPAVLSDRSSMCFIPPFWT